MPCKQTCNVLQAGPLLLLQARWRQLDLSSNNLHSLLLLWFPSMHACSQRQPLPLPLRRLRAPAEYQKLGFVMDIGSKVKRHEAMEAQLAEIERDIRTLEAGDVVLVVPDNGSGY